MKGAAPMVCVSCILKLYVSEKDDSREHGHDGYSSSVSV